MVRTKRAVLAGIAMVTLCGVMAGCRHRSMACKQREIALNTQVETLRRMALGRLTIGTKKEEVTRFFLENKFPVSFDHNSATGSIRTLGCSPMGCGTDEALIGLMVELDEAGSVKAKPVVVGMYTNCL